MLTYPAHTSGKTGMLVRTDEATAMNDGVDDDWQAVVEVRAGESQRHSQTTAELKHVTSLTRPLFEAG
jgi:hypothetical protein